MQLPRRQFLEILGATATTSFVPTAARALEYPTRPVKIIVGFPAGGPADINVRLIAQTLSELLGQAFVVENRPGASGNIAAEFVARAPADGYTLLSLSSAHAINATLYPRLNYDLVHDFAPIACISLGAWIMAVSRSLPVQTVPEFIAFAKANPGKINMGSNGVGATGHLMGELFKLMAGVELQHVPYRGEAPALIDLIGGHIQVLFASISGSIQSVKNGQVRAMAVTTATSSHAVSNVPSLANFLPGYDASAWSGLGAPKNTPIEIIQKLNEAINTALGSESVTTRYEEWGTTPRVGSSSDFGSMLTTEVEKWGRAVKFSGAKPE